MERINVIKIEKASLGDLAELAVLFNEYRKFYGQASDIDGAEQFLSARIKNNEAVIYMGRSLENTAMGFVQLYPIFSSVRMKRLWLMNDLYVTPDFRGRGVSIALIEKAKGLSHACDAAGLILETEKTNTPAIALYHKTGFVRDDQHYYYTWS